MLTRAVFACCIIQLVLSAPADVSKNGCPDADAGFHAEILNSRRADNVYLEYDDEYQFEMETDDMDDGFIAGARYRFEVDENDGDISMRGMVVVASPYGGDSTCGFGQFPTQNWVSANNACPNVAIGEFKPTDMAGFQWRAPQCGCVIFRVAVLTESDEYFTDTDSSFGPLTRVVCEKRSNRVPTLDSSDIDDELGVLDPDFYGLDETDDVIDEVTDEIFEEVDELFGVDSLEDDWSDERYDTDEDLSDVYDLTRESDEDSSDEDSHESHESHESHGRWRGRGRMPRRRWMGRPSTRGSNLGRRTPSRPMNDDERVMAMRLVRNERRGRGRGGRGRWPRMVDRMMGDAPADPDTNTEEVDDDGAGHGHGSHGHGSHGHGSHDHGSHGHGSHDHGSHGHGPHRRWGHHHRGGRHGWHHHGHWHNREDKMDHICEMVGSDRMPERKEAWLNKLRPEVAAKMREEWAAKSAKIRECCQMETTDDKESCMRMIHNERLDSYCAGEAGNRRVNRRTRGINRSILKDTCCSKEGDERYECFHNKHSTLREEKTPERKLEFICSKLERAPRRHDRRLRRMDEDDREDWDGIFEERREALADCCGREELSDRLQCMKELREDRVDDMCDESVELRPPGPRRRGDRRRDRHQGYKEKCCPLEGEARYTCFNNTWWEKKQGWMNRGEDTPCSEGEDCSPHQRHLACCEAGKIFGLTLDDPSWRVCRANAVDYAKEQTMGRVCMAKYKWCCMRSSREDAEE